jgi:pimeloyl-ACP methyl ester carboxylesterase
MSKTIIFISGWAVPKFIAKSKYVWDQSHWSDYKCIWISSKTPTSDSMVEKELIRLQKLLELFPSATLAGQSLGAWWAANLALRPEVFINKLVLWTPLYDTSEYPIFNVSQRYYPKYINRNENNVGPHKVLTFIANNDLIVPPPIHGINFSKKFLSTIYSLNGGHFYQSNHKTALAYMKDWIEVE